MKKIEKFLLTLLTVIVFTACSSSNTGGNCQECNYTIASNETAATVSASLIGVHNLKLDFVANSSYTIAQGTSATFTVSEKEMTIEIDGQECITLKNPIASQSSVEFIFIDNCKDNVKYAISESSNGGLNEVNVISANNTFLAQYK